MHFRLNRTGIEKRMPAATVNLDAMIERDDMAVESDSKRTSAQSRTTMSILDLDGGFFASGLRKPDFQRETTYWTLKKVAELVAAFVNGDLIPAVILWQRGADTFVIDGAHRLSALLSWIHDDYGDRSKSQLFFGPQLPPEQITIAEKTRRLVNKTVGPYSTFKGLAASGGGTSPENQAILEGLRNNSLVVQWVPTSDSKTAENSFFKINQAAQPIDPTERRILQSRNAANAIAARCVVRGGKGHQYWAKFSEQIREEIKGLGEDIYDSLFRPPLSEPVKTLDLPVAGRGYNQLPFAFDLTNLCNGVPLPEKVDAKRIGEALDEDLDGTKTVVFLKAVRRRVRLITTSDPRSLGLHPAVYFYAMSGNFMPNAFLATAEFSRRLRDESKLNLFTDNRKNFENYLFENKIFISLTVTKLGSGARSLGRLSDLFWRVFENHSSKMSSKEISNSLFEDSEFSYLVQSTAPPPRTSRGKTGRMSGATKSAVMMREGYANVNRCAICGAAVHFKSSTVDHIQRRTEGGAADMTNGQISHPYCNTGFKN